MGEHGGARRIGWYLHLIWYVVMIHGFSYSEDSRMHMAIISTVQAVTTCP